MSNDEDLIAIEERCLRDGGTTHSQRVMDLVQSYREQTALLIDAQKDRDNALTLIDVLDEVIGEVRGVCKAGPTELTVLAVRRAICETPTLTTTPVATTLHTKEG